MPNMSYCRFRNTLDALQDCEEHMDDDNLSEVEKKAREELIKLCINIKLNYGHEVNDEEEDEE